MASNPELPHSANQSWERLPNELWSRIFSYLEDIDLLRTVIPVSRRFRAIAYADGFRFENGGLGHRWGQYRFSPEFLNAIPEPESLQFTSSEQYRIECMNSDHRIVQGEQESHIVSTIKTFPGIEKLEIEPALIMREYRHNDQFLSEALSVATNLKELVLAGVVDKYRSPRAFPEVVWSRQEYLDWLESVLALCNKDLRKLRAAVVSPRALICISNFTNLTHLRCGTDRWNDECIQVLSCLPQLSSLTLGHDSPIYDYKYLSDHHYEDYYDFLSSKQVTPAGFDRLFSQNDGAFGRNLKFLAIRYAYKRKAGSISFQRALQRCSELEELHLEFTKSFDTDFCPLRKLRNFKFGARARFEASDGFDLLKSIWANYPILTSLELNVNFLYPTTCPDAGINAIFSKLVHFKKIDRIRRSADVGTHLSFAERILPFCSENVLKSLHFTDLLHVNRDEHPNLEMINKFALERFSTTCGLNSPHLNSISFFEQSWANLKELELENISDCCFERVCENCPGLSHLKISSPFAVADVQMIQPAFDFDLGKLSSLTRLRTLEIIKVADCSEELMRPGQARFTLLFDTFMTQRSVWNDMFRDCNRAFPRDPCGDRLTNFPAMENFRFVFEFVLGPWILSSVAYNMIRTCIGEVKRFILTGAEGPRGLGADPRLNLSFALKSSDISADNVPEGLFDALVQHREVILEYMEDVIG